MCAGHLLQEFFADLDAFWLLFHDSAGQLRIISYENTLFSRLVIFAKQIFVLYGKI